MAEHLFVRARDDSEGCTWVVVDDDGRLLQGLRSGTFRDAARDADGKRVVLLVPGLEVVTTNATLPAASKSRLRQMLPYSLEDTFAEDVEDLTFAIGPRLATGAFQVSVVAKKKLDAWLERAAAAGIAPQTVCADSDGVPNTPSTLTVIIEGDVAFGRRPDEPAFALQGLTLQQAFGVFAAAPAEGSPVQHALVFIDAATQKRHEAEIAALASSLSSLDIKLMHDGPLPAFAAKLANEPGTNLLQGPYAPKSDWGRLLKPWRFAASLVVALVGVTLVASAADYISLRRQDVALTEVVTTQCQQQMSTDRLNQCETELRALLQASGQDESGGENFLSTLATMAEFVTSANTFETMSYRNGVLNVQLSASDVTALDELERGIDETGRFDMSIQSANPREGGGVDARIQIVGLAP
jgi:general secretion pathway protein L